MKRVSLAELRDCDPTCGGPLSEDDCPDNALCVVMREAYSRGVIVGFKMIGDIIDGKRLYPTHKDSRVGYGHYVNPDLDDVAMAASRLLHPEGVTEADAVNHLLGRHKIERGKK